MKTIKDYLLDATCIAMDKREIEKHCGNALAELTRLEKVILDLKQENQILIEEFEEAKREHGRYGIEPKEIKRIRDYIAKEGHGDIAHD